MAGVASLDSIQPSANGVNPYRRKSRGRPGALPG
jgi:hypothetical protein